jgi:hypothetical protein
LAINLTSKENLNNLNTLNILTKGIPNQYRSLFLNLTLNPNQEDLPVMLILLYLKWLEKTQM